MTVVFSGADVEQLRTLAKTFEDASDRLERGRMAVGNQMQIKAWVGPFAAQFRLAWESEHSRRVSTVARALAHNATILYRNADEQAAASAAGGGHSSSLPKATDASGSSLEAAPPNVRGMIDTLHGMNPDDGIRIQKIVAEDGITTRYVVYINGTDSSPDNPWLNSGPENLLAWQGKLGPTDVYLRALLAERIRPPTAEIMLVGFSQGGMHAEMLARSGAYNVTDVVTLNSPAIPQDNNLHGANILRMQDPGQEPVAILGKLSEGFGAVTGGLRDIAGRLTGEGEKGIQTIFVGHADVPGEGILGAHGSKDAHLQIAGQFDASTNSQDMAIKASIANYQSGTVVGDYK